MIMKKEKREYKARLVYYFPCEGCGRKNSRTYHRRTQRLRKCGTCRRREAKFNPNQLEIFPKEGASVC